MGKQPKDNVIVLDDKRVEKERASKRYREREVIKLILRASENLPF